MSGDFTEIIRGFYLEALLIDKASIWYTDVTTGGVHLVGSDKILLPERTMIGGLLLNDDGRILVAGSDGIACVNPQNGASTLIVEGLGGVNEMRSDGRGGMVFGTIDLASILNGNKPGPSAIWHLSSDRTLTKIKDGLTFANGLAVSTDNNMLYFNESFSGVRAYAFDGAAPLGAPLWATDKYDCDGMALDAAGNIWVTGFSSDHLLCLAPDDGRELARITLPGEACTNIRFGGAELNDIYVSMVDHAGAKALSEGRAISDKNSVLYRGPSPVIGTELAKSSFII
jgi:sugar lactone lactonase YvrE